MRKVKNIQGQTIQLYLSDTEETITELVYLHTATQQEAAGVYKQCQGKQPHIFDGYASVSGSLWYDGWISYLQQIENKRKENEQKDSVADRPLRVYFSLGNKEAKTRNKRMATVWEATKTTERWIRNYYNIETILEENEGNHFQNVEKRIGKAIQWLF